MQYPGNCYRKLEFYTNVKSCSRIRNFRMLQGKTVESLRKLDFRIFRIFMVVQEGDTHVAMCYVLD